MSEFVDGVMGIIKKRDAAAFEFHQAVKEVLESIEILYEREPSYGKYKIVERIVEPERVITFRVPWMRDDGSVEVNRGIRVQFNSAIGPYKGGLRFHPSVTVGTLKFLGFEQIFKNALTTLLLGGGKGGSDFDPKGKSDMEVMRFCHSFMLELYRHIDPNTDIPAGDIGVGAREIGYLFGIYKKIVNKFECVLTGKGRQYGGSLIRPEATGYGATYFLMEMLNTKGCNLEDKKVAISGSGNVAQFATQKVTEYGGKVITLSDSTGYIVDDDGIDREKLEFVMWLKNVKRGRIREYSEKFKCEYHEDNKMWASRKFDVAMPCATQNELQKDDAKALVKNGCQAVSEGANMPCVPEAIDIFQNNDVLFGPGKAANAGGVAVSGLEMSQNSQYLYWTRETVDDHLKRIMKDINHQAFETSKEFGQKWNYVLGANIAGFRKVADSMIHQGIV